MDRERLPAIAAQFTQALTSLALGMVAVRALDPAGFGRYALIISTLVMMTGLTTGLIGDTLTVLDRRNPGVRHALQVTALGTSLVSAIALAFVGVRLQWFSVAVAPLVAVLVASFLIEDTLRRALMANRRFASVIPVDLSYALVAGFILLAEWRTGLLSLAGILFAMAVGQVAATAVAIRLLPDDDRYLVPPTRGGFRPVLSFGAWRATQGVIGPARLWAARVMVSAVVGLAAVGTLEANRLLVAPVLLLVQGVGSAILVSYTRVARNDPTRLAHHADRDALTLSAASVVAVCAVLITAPTLSRILLGSTDLLDRRVVLGWGLVAVGIGAALPYANGTSIAGAPGTAVGIRVLDLALSLLGVSVLLLSTDAESTYVWMPAVLGGVVCATVPIQRSRCRRQVERLALGPPPQGDGSPPGSDSAGPTSTAGQPLLARLWQRHWVAICATALILASETKLALKDEISGAGSSVDAYILAEITVYAVVGTYLLMRLTRPPTIAGARPLEVGLVGFVALMALTAPLAPNPIYASVRALEAVVILLLVRDAQAVAKNWFLTFVKAFLGATALLTLVGLALPSQRGPLQLERFNWLATHPVVVGQFLALALVASVVLAAGHQFRLGDTGRALVYWVLAGVFAVALIPNNTRGSAIAALVGVAVGLALVLPRRLWPSTALAAGYAATLLLLTAGPTLLDWLQRDEDQASLTSLNSRLPLWQLSVTRVLEENPFFGFGIGASRTIFVDETGLGGAHNAPLNVLVDLGFVGLALWAWIVITAVVIVIRHVPRTQHGTVERAVWLGSMTVLLVNGATAEGIGGVANVGMIWLFALTARAAQIDRADHANRVTSRIRTAGGYVSRREEAVEP